MKRLLIKNINTSEYWDTHQTAIDFGLRQEKYASLILGDSVAELGCGLSPFLFEIEAERKVGIDFSPVTIRTCKNKYYGIEYYCEDVLETSLEDKSIDTVVAGEIIEHMENPDDLIWEMERIANKRIVISTPILEFKDPEHLWEFSQEDFKQRGFKTEVIYSERFKGRSYIFAYKDL
jgi:ubiquinone/menaquinone biosynthesis C-methylase UbiE